MWLYCVKYGVSCTSEINPWLMLSLSRQEKGVGVIIYETSRVWGCMYLRYNLEKAFTLKWQGYTDYFLIIDMCEWCDFVWKLLLHQHWLHKLKRKIWLTAFLVIFFLHFFSCCDCITCTRVATPAFSLCTGDATFKKNHIADLQAKNAHVAMA